MKMKIKILKFSIAILLVLVVIMGTILFFKSKNDTQITNDLISSRISMVKKLITLEYHYTNMGAMKNQNEFYGWKLPFTEKSFIISYDGVIYAGVDIDKADIKIESKEIIITLPKSKILSHEIKEDSITIFDEKTSIFNPIEIKDYTSFSTDQKKIMEDKAITSGLLDTANENTKNAIEEILLLNPEISKNYKITFR